MATRCPLCDGARLVDTRFGAQDSEGVPRPVFECRTCSGRFIANRPDFIAKVQFSATDPLDPKILKEAESYFGGKKDLDEVDYPYSFLPLVRKWSRGGKILELGCGASQLLPLLKRAGYEAVGFEGVNEVAHVARRNGVAVRKGDFDTIARTLEGERYDLILADQVFEHLLHPRLVLAQLHGLLSLDGKLIFRLPNEGSVRRRCELLLARFVRRREPWSYFIDHWNYFNKRALVECFEGCGYDVLRVKQDLSPQGFLMARVLRVRGLHQLLPRMLARIDSNWLSNGLTIVAARSSTRVRS